MPPEKLNGKPGDARSDLFSLGVVLYEMGAGRHPFPGPSVDQVVEQILDRAAPPLDIHHDEARAEFARIVHRLLDKDPDRRYQTAGEAGAALNNLRRAVELGTPITVSHGGKRTVAVLPFKLLTPASEDEYLSIAVVDAVINHLSASGDVALRPTSAVMRYAKKVSDPFAAGRELNVQVVVDGSIYKSGRHLRVLVQAWSMTDGRTLFSSKHDFDTGDLFEVQDTISNELKQALGLSSGSSASAVPPTTSPMAYELYLRGGERLTRSNQWDIRTAIEMLDRATRLDPTFADAWVRLAISYSHLLAQLGGSAELIRRAERAIRRALALSPQNPEAQFARARLLWTPAKRFQHRAALRALEICLRGRVASQQAQVWQSLILYHVGLLEEATDGLSASLQASVNDPLVFNALGQIAFCRGDYERAEREFDRTLSVDPAGIWGNLWAPMAPLYRNDLENAEERIRAGSKLFPNDAMLAGCEALLWAKRGERRKAKQATARALKGKALVHTHHVWHMLAASHVVLGEAARGIALIRDASNFGLPNYPLFRDDPHFQNLTDNSQYQRILSELRRKWKTYGREFGKA
jgi:TolB-like protein/Flp pilus assembly protein TadD